MATHLRLAGGYDLFGVAILGGLVAGVAAVPIGIVALRTRRHTFVVITIAVFFIFQLVATNLSFTQGSEGVVLPSGQFSASTYNDPFYGFLASCCWERSPTPSGCDGPDSVCSSWPSGTTRTGPAPSG